MSILGRIFGRPEREPSSKTQRDAAPPSARALEARLILLGKFTEPTDLDAFSDGAWRELWQNALGETLEAAVGRMVSERELRQPTAAERLTTLPLSKLKEVCAAKGLKVSGKKAVLAARLVEADEQYAHAVAPMGDLLVCTEDGLARSAQYQAVAKARRLAAQEETVAALQGHDFASAAEIVAGYEVAQVFPRGVGGHWDARALAQEILEIFEARPWFLQGLSPKELQSVRTVAAADALWGTRVEAKVDRRAGLSTGRFDVDIAARLLQFSVSNARTLQDCRRAGVAVVEVIASPKACGFGRSIDGSRYRVDEAPELPSPKCDAELGCTCCYGAVPEEV